MKILFLGTKFGNSYLQYKALKRVYNNVDFLDGYNCFKFKQVIKTLFVHFNPKIFENKINRYILKNIKNKYDLIYIKSGELIGKKLIDELKKRTKKIVFFCNDNPFVSRDKNKWKLFLESGKYFDLIAFQDKSRIALSKKFGIKKTLLILPPYDDKIHIEHKISKLSKKKISNDVIFVGTWSIEKSLFLQKLIKLGLNIKIFGSRWDKDKNYKKFKERISIGHLYNKDYAKIIQSAKIAICLFEKKNLDTITARSIEIPAIGTFLCSKRTKSMEKIFIENKEAIFFDNPTECVKKCKYYLSNPKKRNKISSMGKKKITKILKPTNVNLIKKIIIEVFKNKKINEN